MRSNAGSRRSRRVPLLALPFLVACTTNTSDLAPSTPNALWPIKPPAIMERTADADRTAAETNGGAASNPRDNAISIDPARTYDLPELIDLAQRSNPETRDAWERARKAAFAVGLVESAYLPQISAEAVAGYQHATFPIPPNLAPSAQFTVDTRELLPTLAIKWLLFDFGRRANAETAARADSFAANVTFTGAHQKLIFAVSRDYFALSAARGRLHVAEEALKNAQIVEDAVRTRRKQGFATTVEVAQAARQTAEARFNLARTTGDEHSAYHALIASMGTAPTTRIKIADNSSKPLPPTPGHTVDEFVTSAMADRPDVIAALGRLRGAQAKLDEAHADYKPTIGVEAQGFQNIGSISVDDSRYYSINKPGGSILLKFSWPLFDGGAREARVGIARSNVNSARDQLDQAKNTAVKQVTDAYDSLETGFAEHASAYALQTAAQTAYDAALDAYGHGFGTYTELVTSETALTRSQSALGDAHADVFTAAAALAFATGSISAQDAR